MPRFSLIATAACMLGLVAADFQIYTHQDRAFVDNGVENAYLVVPGESDCDGVTSKYVAFHSTDEVTGVVGGARCKSDGCMGGTVRGVHEFELRTGKNYANKVHFTLYEDRGYVITNADDGAILGSCVYDTGDDYLCSGGFSGTDGQRLFICTSSLTAEYINDRT